MPDINDKGEGNRIITNKIASITSSVEGTVDNEFVMTGLWSPETTVASGKTYDLTMNVYVGTKQHKIRLLLLPLASFKRSSVRSVIVISSE